MVVVFFTAAVFFWVSILLLLLLLLLFCFCFWEALHDFCCFPKSVAEIEIGNIYRQIPLKHTRSYAKTKVMENHPKRMGKMDKTHLFWPAVFFLGIFRVK